MITLDITWEQNLRNAHQGALKTRYGNDRIMAGNLRRSLNTRIKEINKMIAAGTAVYREAKEKFFTVKDNTINQEFTYPTMDQAQAEQERRVIVLGHDAEVL